MSAASLILLLSPSLLVASSHLGVFYQHCVVNHIMSFEALGVAEGQKLCSAALSSDIRAAGFIQMDLFFCLLVPSSPLLSYLHSPFLFPHFVSSRSLSANFQILISSLCHSFHPFLSHYQLDSVCLLASVSVILAGRWSF